MAYLIRLAPARMGGTTNQQVWPVADSGRVRRRLMLVLAIVGVCQMPMQMYLSSV